MRRTKRYSQEEAEEKMLENGYRLLSKYTNGKSPITFMCRNGHITEGVSFNYATKDFKCVGCYGRVKYTYDQVKATIESEGYKLLSTTYKNNKTKLNMECGEGHNYSVKFTDFLGGSRCAACRGVRKYTHAEVESMVNLKGYRLLSTAYKSNKEKLHMECPQGHRFFRRLSDFKKGCFCPHCSRSSGEKLVMFILERILPPRAHITTEYPVTLSGSARRYDFRILLDHHEIFIEYDGEFHFQERTFSSNAVSLSEQQKIDEEKDKYATSTGAIMIRIPYYLNRSQVVEELVTRIPGAIKSDIDFGTLNSYMVDKTNLRDICMYYLDHTSQDTQRKYGVSDALIKKNFRKFTGVGKVKYLQGKYITKL